MKRGFHSHKQWRLLPLLLLAMLPQLHAAPPITSAAVADNPYLQAIEDRLDHALQKADTGKDKAETLLSTTAWAYQDPASRHHANPRLLQIMAAAVDRFFLEAAARPDPTLHPKPPAAPPTLQEVYDDPPMASVNLHTSHHGALMAFTAAIRNPKIGQALGPDRLAAIRKSLQKHAVYWRDLEKSPMHEQPWFYAMAILNLSYAYLSTEDTIYLEKASRWFTELHKSRGYDGALEYMRDSPEFGPVYWYTDATLYELGVAHLALSERYLDASAQPQAAAAAAFIQRLDEFARGLTPSYKKNIIAPGYNEYYSVIWWKHLPRTTSMPYATAALGLMSGDPQIVGLAREEARRGYFYDGKIFSTRTLQSGLFIRKLGALKAEPLPDHYSFYDANRIGVRGRFGRFNHTLQAGAHAGTVAGATLLSDKRELQATLQRVAPVIRKNPDPDAARDDLGGLWILSWPPATTPGIERPPVGVVHADNIGLVATRYHPLMSHWAEDGVLEKKLAQSRDWEVKQLWLSTPSRLVGFTRTKCLKANAACGVALWNSFSEVHTLSKLSDKHYNANGLIYHIHEHSYPRIGLAPSRAAVALDRDKKWAGLYLTDETGAIHFLDGKMTPSHAYTAGQTWHAIIDVHEEGTAPAKVQLLLEENGVIALRVQDANLDSIALFNSTELPVTLTHTQLQLPQEAKPVLHRGAFGGSWATHGTTIHLPPREAILLKLP